MRAPTMGPGSSLLRVFAYAPASLEAHSPLLSRTLPPLNPVCLGCNILCASKKEKKMLLITYHMPSCIGTPPSLQSVQFSSVAQSCPILCDPMACSMARPPCPSPTPRVSSFVVLSFCLFILLKARILKWFAIPFSMDHILSEPNHLRKMNHLEWIKIRAS